MVKPFKILVGQESQQYTCQQMGDKKGQTYWNYSVSPETIQHVGSDRMKVPKARGLTCVVLHPGWVSTDMGGAAAPVTPPVSVAGMTRVIEGLKPADTGCFINYDGARFELPLEQLGDRALHLFDGAEPFGAVDDGDTRASRDATRARLRPQHEVLG